MLQNNTNRFDIIVDYKNPTFQGSSSKDTDVDVTYEQNCARVLPRKRRTVQRRNVSNSNKKRILHNSFTKKEDLYILMQKRTQ